MPQPKYGTVEWEEQYLKNRKKNPAWDYKSLTKIHTQSAGFIVLAKCKKTGKWMTGEYPVGGFRYMLTLRAALLFNGVWKSIEEAKAFVKKRIDLYGDDCGEIEYIETTTNSLEVLDAIAGHFKIP